ncbi:MAG: PorV/PorQ family protein [bacterium]
MNATRTVLPAAPLVALALAAQGLVPASAEDLTGGVAGDWLSRYTGAGTAGLGGAFVATANTPFGMLWNPAGIARMYQNEVHFEMSQLFEGTQFHSVGFAMPSQSLPSFGLAVLSLRSGDFERTNDLNEPQGSFQEGEMAFVLSASKNLSRRLSLGTNVKVVRQSIAEFDAAGFGADLGVMFDVTDGVRLGASLLNLAGPSLKLREVEEKYPVEMRGGGAWRFLDGRGLVSMEVDHREGPGVAFRGGTEFWVHPTMALRMGYDGGSPAGGMSYRVSPSMQLDYGLADHELGVTHKIGIAYRFGGFFASSKADPQVFSPLGEKAVTKFALEAHAKSAIEKWSLDIVDKQDQVVRRFSGREEPPSHVMWDGKDESGVPLPDGAYTYRLVVVDSEGREMADHERVIEIATGGPSGHVPVHLE